MGSLHDLDLCGSLHDLDLCGTLSPTTSTDFNYGLQSDGVRCGRLNDLDLWGDLDPSLVDTLHDFDLWKRND